MNTICVLTVFN